MKINKTIWSSLLCLALVCSALLFSKAARAEESIQLEWTASDGGTAGWDFESPPGWGQSFTASSTFYLSKIGTPIGNLATSGVAPLVLKICEVSGIDSYTCLDTPNISASSSEANSFSPGAPTSMANFIFDGTYQIENGHFYFLFFTKPDGSATGSQASGLMYVSGSNPYGAGYLVSNTAYDWYAAKIYGNEGTPVTPIFGASLYYPSSSSCLIGYPCAISGRYDPSVFTWGDVVTVSTWDNYPSTPPTLTTIATSTIVDYDKLYETTYIKIPIYSGDPGVVHFWWAAEIEAGSYQGIFDVTYSTTYTTGVSASTTEETAVGLFGKTPHDLACSADEWNTPDPSFDFYGADPISVPALNWTVNRCSATEVIIKAVSTVANVLRSGIEFVVSSATTALKTIFPFNLIVKVSTAWTAAGKATEMPTEAAWIDSFLDEDGNAKATVPNLFGGVSTTTWQVWGPDSRTEQSSFWAGVRAIMSLLLWVGFIYGVIHTGQDIMNEIKYQARDARIRKENWQL